MRAVFNDAALIAPSESRVLITGESGVGKEVLADAIHRWSPRAKGPLVKVNCAAIPETLLESELFGHEKGAFTGAHQTRTGRFEEANGGTIFLDEISEMSPQLQAKLLRVTQDGTFRRVGSGRELHTNARILAATNKNLEAQIKEGRFREDLFYRLAVVELGVPPLRERREDILPLAAHFIGQFGGDKTRFSPIVSEDWSATPGLATSASCATPWNARHCFPAAAWCSRNTCRAGCVPARPASSQAPAAIRSGWRRSSATPSSRP